DGRRAASFLCRRAPPLSNDNKLPLGEDAIVAFCPDCAPRIRQRLTGRKQPPNNSLFAGTSYGPKPATARSVRLDSRAGSPTRRPGGRSTARGWRGVRSKVDARSVPIAKVIPGGESGAADRPRPSCWQALPMPCSETAVLHTNRNRVRQAASG